MAVGKGFRYRRWAKPKATIIYSTERAQLHSFHAQHDYPIRVWQSSLSHRKDYVVCSSCSPTPVWPPWRCGQSFYAVFWSFVYLQIFQSAFYQWNTALSLSVLSQSQLFRSTYRSQICWLYWGMTQTPRSIQKTNRKAKMKRQNFEPEIAWQFCRMQQRVNQSWPAAPAVSILPQIRIRCNTEWNCQLPGFRKPGHTYW